MRELHILCVYANLTKLATRDASASAVQPDTAIGPLRG